MGGQSSQGKGTPASGGKGGSGDSNFFDWVLNPVGTAVKKVWDVEVDPTHAMFANIATKITGSGEERPWTNQWIAPIVGEQTTPDYLAGQQDITDRQSQHDEFLRRYSPSNDSLLADEED